MEKMDTNLNFLIYGRDSQSDALKDSLMENSLQVLNLLLQIVRGFLKLQSLLFPYMIIKPENVLINHNIVNDRVEITAVKLTVSKMFKQVSNVYMSDRPYMAPEIENDNCTDSPKQHAYNFGVLLGEIICGLEAISKSEYTYEKFIERGYGTLYYLYESCIKSELSERADLETIALHLEILFKKEELNQLQAMAEQMMSDVTKKMDQVEDQYNIQYSKINESKNALINSVEERATTIQQ